MIDNTAAPQNRLKLKKSTGWFAVGDGFREVLPSLSDGAFKLFAYLNLYANRQTGRIEATHQELAAVLGKSKRIIGSYIDELQQGGMCAVRHGKNQYARSIFEICEHYWPYERVGSVANAERQAYIDAVRESFLALGCVTGKFGPADVRLAEDLQRRAIPLAVVRQALLFGACRKYSSWLDNGESAPVKSLHYFKEVIEEVQRQPFPAGYEGYLQKKLKQFAQERSERMKAPPSHKR
jgi:hypothetical protein